MNRRIWGVALAVAAASLAILLFFHRAPSTVRENPVVGEHALETRQQPPMGANRRLPQGLRVNPGNLPAPDGWQSPQRRRPGYQAERVETVRGRVAMSVRMQNRLRQGGQPERIILESAGEQIIVKLGPPRGLRDIGFERLNLGPGDDVEVMGSRLPGPRRVIIAATVTKGDQTIVLRDGSGEPAWLAPRRGAHQRPPG